MGNSPSNSRGATPNSASHHHSHSAGGGPGNDSPRATKKEPKSLTSLQHAQRSAASPEASAVLAHGSTISGRTSQSRPLSVLTSSSPSTSINHTPAGSAAPSRSSESKSRPVSEFRAEPSKPVDVPLSNPDAAAAAAAHDSLYDDVGLGSGLPSSSVQDMSSYIPRPPRLPLPIEEEIHTPGSPIVAPEDVGDDIDTAPLEKDTAILPRRASGLSNATDEDDSEELRVDKTRPTVPTRVEWLGGGQKVYVTGTPFQWSRKQRLNPVPGREGVLETIIPVFPGTHHLKFLVDGNMQTSPDLPTTVDFGNNLVNYIEVNGDDAAASDVIVDPTVPKSNKEASDLPSRSGSADGLKGGATKKPQLKVIEPADIFTPALPAYLTDFDQPEESASYKLATAAQDKLPMPPALPGFLSKPILNNTTMIKDDNSVLNMPNHTVLNHLGTCSIKNNVLAVSATTRYRNKYVTTIIYKPTD